jgi:hypothetical protein
MQNIALLTSNIFSCSLGLKANFMIALPQNLKKNTGTHT